MARTILTCSLVLLVAATAGCRMGAHPYDYCRPTFTGECGGCLPNAREGSILSGGIGPEMVSTSAGAELAPTPDEWAGPIPGVQQPVAEPKAATSNRWATRLSQRTTWQ